MSEDWKEIETKNIEIPRESEMKTLENGESPSGKAMNICCFITCGCPLIFILIEVGIVTYGIWGYVVYFIWTEAPFQLLILGMISLMLVIAYVSYIGIGNHLSVSNNELKDKYTTFLLTDADDFEMENIIKFFFLPFYFVWKDLEVNIQSKQINKRNMDIFDFNTLTPAKNSQLLWRNLSEVVIFILTMSFSAIFSLLLQLIIPTRRRIGDYIASTIRLREKEKKGKNTSFWDKIGEFFIVPFIFFVVIFSSMSSIMFFGITLLVIVAAIGILSIPVGICLLLNFLKKRKKKI